MTEQEEKELQDEIFYEEMNKLYNNYETYTSELENN